MPYDDPCLYCSHARDMHTPACQCREALPSSGERPGGVYVCGCEVFREPVALSELVHAARQAVRVEPDAVRTS